MTRTLSNPIQYKYYHEGRSTLYLHPWKGPESEKNVTSILRACVIRRQRALQRRNPWCLQNSATNHEKDLVEIAFPEKELSRAKHAFFRTTINQQMASPARKIMRCVLLKGLTQYEM